MSDPKAPILPHQGRRLRPQPYAGDGLVDLTDLPAFAAYLTGPDAGSIEPPCRPGNFDEDDDIDLTDFAALTKSWTPPF